MIGRRPVAALGAVVLALAVVGCGVPTDAQPRQVDPDQVPFDLLDPDQRSAADESTTGNATIFLVDSDGQLVERRRRVPDGNDVVGVITALLAGPGRTESTLGLRSAVPSGTILLGVVGPDNGLVTLDLSATVADIPRQDQRAALGQLALTAIAIDGVNSVLFALNGEAQPVPGADGQLTDEPLVASDLRELLASS